MKTTQVQKARIFCIKHGHAPYVYCFWGYVYCGRCGTQIGDRIGSIFLADKVIVIGCKDKHCKNCDPIKKKLSALDKEILKRLTKQYKKEGAILDNEKALTGLKIQ